MGQLTYGCTTQSVNIIKQWKLTQGNANHPVVLSLVKLMPSVDQFWKLVFIHRWTQEKVSVARLWPFNCSLYKILNMDMTTNAIDE